MPDDSPPPGYRTQSEDTSYAAERLLFERWSTMRPSEKVQLVGEMSDAIRQMARVGLRRRFPEACAREIELRLVAQLYGRDLVRRLMGIDVPDEDVRFA
ncbi:MAG: hypothetical protein R3F34_03530 [Planctomycetota bacterium]